MCVISYINPKPGACCISALPDPNQVADNNRHPNGRGPTFLNRSNGL